MRILVLTICLALLSITSNSQQFGGTPPSQKWEQINSDTARIIFPAGLDSQANRIAAIVHFMAAKKPVSLGDKLKKVSIVLQHQTVIPNGYAGLGPFRSEFYLTPQSNNFEQGSVSWGDQLALHEYRHIQQYNNFDNGLSKIMKVLFGQEGYALAINAAIPDWFYEGDAVYNETVLTKQGRGRLPLFLNAYPSLWTSVPGGSGPKKYSWMKLRNGSLKDYVPSHYNLGYLMINYGREKYGENFWTKVTSDASAFKGLFYPFQKAVKTHAGISYKKFREDAFNSYKSQAGRESNSRDEYVFPVRKNYVSNYYFPYSAGADSLVYLKTTFRHRPAFYVKDADGEHKIKVRNISLDEQYSYKNGRIVYASYENDARWNWRDYSVINVLDVATRKQKTITKNSKYFTPDISADGSKIAAVSISPQGISELHILDASNGNVLNRINAVEINLFTDPKFIDDNTLVTAVRFNDGRMSLALAEVSTGNTVRITNPSYNVVGFPSISNGIIYFTANYEGNDDVFALRLSDRSISRVTEGPFGNYFVNAGNGKLTWSAFTSEGYQLKQIPVDSSSWKKIPTASVEQVMTKFPVRTNQPGVPPFIDSVGNRSFAVSKYSKATGLINIHSWRPNYSAPIYTYSIYGQNILNTLQTEIYALYNEDERTPSIGINAIYSGLFPYIHLGTEYTFGRTSPFRNRVRTWDQLDTRLGLSLPFSKTKGQTYRNFSAGSFYVLRNEFNKGLFKDSLGNISFSYLLHTLSYTRQVQRAVQHIYPKWAFNFLVNHRHAISYYEGYQFFGSTSFYVPGILPQHNLIFSAAYQQRDTSLALFSTRFPDARGFPDYYRTNAGSKMWKVSANYHLPLVYPDWGFGNILYFQRIRANLFYDYQLVYFNDRRNSINLQSAGGELFFDTKWWNQHPISFGARMSFLLSDDPLTGQGKGTSVFELVLPVSLY